MNKNSLIKKYRLIDKLWLVMVKTVNKKLGITETNSNEVNCLAQSLSDEEYRKVRLYYIKLINLLMNIIDRNQVRTIDFPLHLYSGLCTVLDMLVLEETITTNDHYNLLKLLKQEVVKKSYKHPFQSNEILIDNSFWFTPKDWNVRLKFLSDVLFNLENHNICLYQIK